MHMTLDMLHSTARMKGKRYMRASYGRHAGYTQIDYTFPMCYTHDMHAQYACGKLTPAWPTEIFVL